MGRYRAWAQTALKEKGKLDEQWDGSARFRPLWVVGFPMFEVT
jgi:aspartyl-tRNA synthetase